MGYWDKRRIPITVKFRLKRGKITHVLALQNNRWVSVYQSDSEDKAIGRLADLKGLGDLICGHGKDTV